MQPSLDILIVGAGPAGCAAAYDLARAGKRVLLLDKRSFPRHKACAAGLTRKTLAALRYSVEPVIERLCHEIVLQQDSPASEHSELRICFRIAPAAQATQDVGLAICAMTTREAFDHFCLTQTLTSGRSGGSVTLLKVQNLLDLRELPTRIELDVATIDGPQTLRAPILLGADGSNGQTRALHTSAHQTSASSEANAVSDWFTRGFAMEAAIPYTALPSDLPRSYALHDLVFDFAPISGGYGWLFPKGDHINIGVGVFAPGSSEPKLKKVNRQLLVAYIRQKLGVDLRAIDPAVARVTGQHLGMGGDRYIPHGRVLLLGDAAGLVDSLTGEGIHSAVVSGQAAAAAILSNEPDIAAAYARNLTPLQQTLAFSRRAAQAFYAQPDRGFRFMRIPLVRNLVLKTYANGVNVTRLQRGIEALSTARQAARKLRMIC